MKYKVITESEALDLINSDPERMPIRILTDAGKRAVAEFVESNAKNPERHDIEAWYDNAERTIEATIPGESASMEMRGFDSVSGRPELLYFGPGDYEWHAYVEVAQ